MGAKFNKINGYQISEMADYLLNRADVFSMDCFDTLLWRSTQRPVDVFFSLTKRPEFALYGISPSDRMEAEAHARRRKMFHSGSSGEVNLREIYREAGVAPDRVEELISAEIDEEIKFGYIFQPIFLLAQEAKKRGKRVIVVSDTYYSSLHLERLLFAVCPALSSIVDKIYTSSDYGVSKSLGLWHKICARENIGAASIVHIGDNAKADFITPQEVGINAYHLDVKQNYLNEVEAQREVCASIALPSSRINNPILDPFRGLLAQCKIDSAEKAIGYGVLGPVMLAFANTILESRGRVLSEGRRCHLGFLLRDGYLISEVMKLFLPAQERGALLNVSRAVTLESTIESLDDIDEIILSYFNPKNYENTFKLLSLPAPILADIREVVGNGASVNLSRIREIFHRSEVAELIIGTSKLCRDRLEKHIFSQIKSERGDVILFVDLGYSGTAQNRLQKRLEGVWGIELRGCYLISLRGNGKQTFGPRYGVLQAEFCDQNLLRALVDNRIAAFEMLCANGEGSTVGFDELGNPKFSSVVHSATQTEAVRLIQSYCLDFIKKWMALPEGFRPAITKDSLAQVTATELSRFSFFPTAHEIDVLASFDFDLGLQTDYKNKIFDLDSAEKAVKSNGITYIQSVDQADRVGTQLELRAIDASYAMASFILTRFGSTFDFSKNSYRNIGFKGFIINNSEQHLVDLATRCTHDGCHSLIVPCLSDWYIGVRIGELVPVMQLICVEGIFDDPSLKRVTLENSCLGLDGFTEIAERIFTVKPDGNILFPSLQASGGFSALNFVFRPLA